MDASVRSDAGEQAEPDTGVRDAGREPAADSGRDAEPEPPRDAGVTAPPADASTVLPDDDAGELSGFEVLAIAPERELVEPSTPIRVQLSAEVDRDSVDANTFAVKRGGRAVKGELEVERDGIEFRPHAPWAPAASYEVELTAGVRDVRGRALAPRTFELRAREGRWSVTGISPALHQPRSNLVVAANGKAAVAWVNGGLQFRSYTPEHGWTETERVSDETERVFYPSLAINERGQIVSSWNYETNPVGRVYLPGRGWQPHFYFRGVPGGGQEVRRASWILSDAGESVGVFSLFRLPPVEIGTVDAVRFQVESEERSVHAISASDAGFDTDPHLAWLGSEPLFIWVEDVRSDPTTPRPEIRTRHGVTGMPHSLSALDRHARSPALASALDGRSAWAVWEEIDGAQASLWAAKLDQHGMRGTPERISQNYEATPLEANPTLALDASGDVHVVWEQPPAAIWTARFEAGRGWTPALRLSAADAPGTQPVIALEPGGNAVTLWAATERGMDQDSRAVMVARYVAATGWSVPAEVARDDHGASMLSDRVEISVGLDDSGRGWACWTGHGQLNLARFE